MNRKIIFILSFLVLLLFIGGIFIYYPIHTPETITESFFSTSVPVTPRSDGRLCEEIPLDVRISWEQIRASSPPVSSGIGSGMLYDDLPGATSIGLNTFQIPVNTALSGSYHIWYPNTAINTHPLNLRYIALLNEQQLAGGIGETHNLYYDITLQPGEDRTVTLNIPPLAEGIHEFIVVGISNIDRDPTSTGFATLDFGRFTLVAGENPQVHSRPYVAFPPAPENSSSPSVILNLSLAPEIIRVWNWPETRLRTSPNTNLNFYIQFGYDSAINPRTLQTASVARPDYIVSAIVLFVDYRQVNINADEVLYALVAQDTNLVTVETILQTPEEKGTHDIVVLRINYPGVPMCILSGNLEGQFFPFPIYGWRVGIENQ